MFKIKRKIILTCLSFSWSSYQWQQSKSIFTPNSIDQNYLFRKKNGSHSFSYTCGQTKSPYSQILLPKHTAKPAGFLKSSGCILSFFSSVLQTYLFGFRTPKTNFVLTPNFIFQVYSSLIVPLDINSHLSFKIGPPVICALLLKVGPKFHQICFMTHLINHIFQKRCGKKTK